MRITKILDHTEEQPPINPSITYEVVADFGEDGTKTIYSSNRYHACLVAIDEINIGELDNIDITEQELEDLKGLSISVVLTGVNLDIITYGSEMSASAEINAYKVEKEI